MSRDKLKSVKVAEKFGLKDKMSVDTTSGVINLPEDYYESTLEATGLTLDQIKKLQKHNAELLGATTLIAGELAAEAFRENPDLGEVSFSYTRGHDHSKGFFKREGTDRVYIVEETYGVGTRGEMGKVFKHLTQLFDEINT